MALVVTDDKHYKNIANMIRENSDNNVLSVKPEQMSSAIQEVADYKESLGLEQGKQEGYQEGKQAEYDAFWDAYQINGIRINYDSAFAGEGWHKDNFKPKYKITPKGVWCAKSMFYHFGLGYTDILDFRDIKHLFDFSNVDTAVNMFCSARINYVELDLSNCTDMTLCFSDDWSRIYRTHTTLKVSEKCTNYSGCFNYNRDLTHLIFMDGSNIAANINVSSATGLVKESIESIINALWDNTSGKTLTLSLTAVKKAFETSSGANDGNTSEEWLSLVASKSNWTISLA